ncbi:MAG: VanW family protein, partial [Clostridia bacterium]
MKKTIVYLSSAALVLVLVVLYMFFVKSDDSMLSSSETDSLIAQKQKEIETFKADITTKSDELQTLRELVKKLQSDISTAETKILELNSLGTKELQIQIETLKLDIEAKSKNLELLIKESENYKKAQNTAYTMLISTFSTTYNNSDSARSTNISNATRSISGRIVMPNEEFSFINIIGECTAPKGYVESKVFYKGELTQGMGGGVCQVS